MPDLDDQTKQAFTSATDWAKQILTLSTGIVTLTISFSDKIFGDLSKTERWTLSVAWGLYVISIIGGVWLLSSLTGTLAAASPPTPAAVNATNNRVPALVQLLTFLAATIAIFIFGCMAVGNEKSDTEKAAAAAIAVQR
jgi:hypothetical protein